MSNDKWFERTVAEIKASVDARPSWMRSTETTNGSYGVRAESSPSNQSSSTSKESTSNRK